MQTASNRIDDLQILVGRPGQRTGAAFRLVEAPKTAAAWTRSDGWTVRVSASSRYVVAQGGRESLYTAAWRDAYAVTQEALDVWSARGIADWETDDPSGNHITFWDGADGAAVRTAAREILRITVGTPRVEVRDARGDLVPQPAPPEDWHQSMRFFRQSQRATDLFDSLRSLWLALENLLDSIEAYRPGSDREEGWLKRALQAAGRHVTLPAYLPAPAGSGRPKAPHNAAYDYFYADLRTHLFHAKASRQPSLPRDADAAHDLADRHERLTRLYLDLLSATSGVSRMSGGMMIGGFNMAVAFLDDTPRVLVSDDSTPFDPDQRSPTPADGRLLAGPAARDSALEQPFLRVYVGYISGSELRLLDAVRRLMFEAGGRLVSVHAFEGDLVLHDIGHFYSQVEFGLHNTQMPRSFAPT